MPPLRNSLPEPARLFENLRRSLVPAHDTDDKRLSLDLDFRHGLNPCVFLSIFSILHPDSRGLIPEAIL